MKNTLLIALTLLFGLGSVSAQISLDDYRIAVADYSYELGNARYATIGAEADHRRAKKNYLPSLHSSRDMVLNFRKTDGGRRVDWVMRPEITQPVIDGGALRAETKQAEEALKVARADELKAMLDVVFEAEQAYWSLSRAEIYRGAISDYITIVRSLREVVLHRFEEGYISKSDLLQVESRMSDAEYQLSAAEQNYLVELHNFNILRGESPSLAVELKNSILDSIAMPLRVDVESVVRFRPEYRASVARSESARWGIKAASAEFVPSLNVSLFGLVDAGELKGGKIRLDGGMLFSFTTPIFHFRERKQALISARSAHHRAELAVADMVDRITLEESDGWTNILNSRSRVDATRRNLELAHENLEISTYSYREGLSTILDVLQAQISWLQIYTNAITAQYDYAIAVAEYKRITSH
mgnify:FL=1